ncbi:MAG: FAD-dependent oxidoreductase, partial [Clostridia bacterium]
NPWENQSHLPEHARDRYALAVRHAREAGEIRYNPNDIFCAATPVDRHHPETLSVNFTRIQRLSAVDADELTQAEMLGREQVHEALHFMKKYVIGNEEAYLVNVPPYIGVRESRRILGEAYLTADDIKRGTRFPDAIARGIYMIDTHNPTAIGEPSHLEYLDQPYDIPYGCLLPKGRENLLVAGRCISGDTVALSSFRILAACMNTGEAAGAAAALSVKSHVSPRKLDVGALQQSLEAMGAHIRPNGALPKKEM